MIKEIKKFLWLLIRIHIFTVILHWIAVQFMLSFCSQNGITEEMLMSNTDILALGMIGSFFIWLWFHTMDEMFDSAYSDYYKDLAYCRVEKSYPVKVIKL